eukprot:c27982_g5_i1 orf=327-824(+)
MAKTASCRAISSIFCLLIAAGVAFFHHEEKRIPSARIDYASSGFFRDAAHWDPFGQRFLVSFIENGVGGVRSEVEGGVGMEEILVQEEELRGNASLGFKVDVERERVVVVVADLYRNKFSALVAYDIKSWERIFMVKLAGAGMAQTCVRFRDFWIVLFVKLSLCV